MIQPNSNSKEHIYYFLIWCIENNKIDIWNQWKETIEYRLDLNEANLECANLDGAIFLIQK